VLLRLLAGAALVAVTAVTTAVVIRLTTPTPADAGRGPAAEDRQEPPGAGDAKAPAPAPKAADGKAAKERFLKALGSLSAAHVYQSYLNVGLLADGVESGAYTKAEAEQMLTTVGNMIDMVDRQLDKIADAGLDADDRQGVKRIQDLTVLLRRQASALRAYWATGEAEQVTRYQQAREAAWTNLSETLGIE
jgi:hypothetical protein